MSTAPIVMSFQEYVPKSVTLASDCASYTAITGVRAPLFDPTRPLQPWWDTAAALLPPSGTYNLYYISGTSTSFARQSITNGQAATPNLAVFGTFPTLANYLAQQAAISTQTVLTFAPPTVEAPIASQNNRLVPAVIAAQVLAEINEDTGAGATLQVERTNASGQVWSFDPADSRRPYLIVIGANSWDLSELLNQRFASGVWCPGTWSLPPTLQANGPLFAAQTFPSNPGALGTTPYPVDSSFMGAGYQLVAVMAGDVVLEQATGTPQPGSLTLVDVINTIKEFASKFGFSL